MSSSTIIKKISPLAKSRTCILLPSLQLSYTLSAGAEQSSYTHDTTASEPFVLCQIVMFLNSANRR